VVTSVMHLRMIPLHSCYQVSIKLFILYHYLMMVTITWQNMSH